MKKPLLELLLEEGHISRKDMQEVAKIQQKSPLKVEQIILKKGLADELQILSATAKQHGYSFESTLTFKSDDAFAAVPLELIQKSRIVPLIRQKDLVTVAIHDPRDIHPMDDVRSALAPLMVEFVVAPEAEIMRIIHNHYDRSASDAKEVMDGIQDEEYSEFDSLAEDTLDLANEAPIIRMANAILAQAVQERASDIHIEPYEKSMEVRYRIDGVLHRRLTPPRVVHAGLVSRLKIMSNLNIAENRLPQDGRIKIKISGKDIDIRVSTIPTQFGERVVMRLLNKSDISFSMDSMGYSSDLMAELKKVIYQPNGIFLVTGPTGSGKSTTLYSFLKELSDESRNILSVEDPVEYEIPGVAQMQVQEKIGLTFANALRAFLRQDPDIIMVGEIRDKDTARIAIQAALTGHLVISTLHTNDASSAVTRLVDMGIEPYLICSTVRAVLAQRLVRVICPGCKKPYKPTSAEVKDFGFKPAELKKGKVRKGAGCAKCVETGYRGRNGIFEFLTVDNDIQRLILQGADSESIKKVAVKNGMKTLKDFGKQKVLEGVTTTEEIIRVS